MKVKPGTQMAAAVAGQARLRAARADRERVLDLLKAAFVQGRLTKDELEARVGQVFASRTYAELAAVTADIPVGLVVAQPSAPTRARTRVPMNTAITGTACLIVVAHLGLLLAVLSGSGLALILLGVFIVVGTIVAIGVMITSST